MPSPYPKPHRGRGKRPAEELEASDHAPVPALPRGLNWPERRRNWWRAVWRSPVATKWDADLDFEAVLRLGRLYELPEPSAAVLAQIARLENDLLLNPASRQRAYVTLPRQQPASAAGQRAASPRSSARERVRAIDPSLSALTAADFDPDDVPYHLLGREKP